MKPLKIGIVSYLNTLPFVCGLQQLSLQAGEHFELVFAYPSQCTRLFYDQKVDMALVPTGALDLFPGYKPQTDYAIGSFKKVDTVLLLSEVPLDQIEQIYLDYQSNTSVKLLQILAKYHWRINPQMINADRGFETKIRHTTAGLIIGDRAFDAQKHYPFVFDLSENWYHFTQLPFVFAVWLAHPHVSQDMIGLLNETFQYGINQIEDCVNRHNDLALSKEQTMEYLTKKIAYRLDADKRLAIEKFLFFSQDLSTHSQ